LCDAYGEFRDFLKMKGVFVMNTSLHDILFMTLDDDLRNHYRSVAVKQGLCQVTRDDCCYHQFISLPVTRLTGCRTD